MTPWTAALQASLSITNFWSLLKLISIKLVMPSSHLIYLAIYFFLLPPPPNSKSSFYINHHVGQFKSKFENTHTHTHAYLYSCQWGTTRVITKKKNNNKKHKNCDSFTHVMWLHRLFSSFVYSGKRQVPMYTKHKELNPVFSCFYLERQIHEHVCELN